MQQRIGWIWIGLALITFGVYASALQNEFVNYDDPDYVTENVHIQGGVNAQSLAWAFTTGHASNWHPLTWISHTLDWQWFGSKAAGHHFTNVVFHVLNTLLVFALLRQMTGALWPSAFVAAVFGWHPLHVESVAWISERKDVLSTFFWLLTMGAYGKYAAQMRSAECGVRNGRQALSGAMANGYYWLALGFFALGLMSKPMLVTLPFALLLLDYWPLGRIGDWKQVEGEKARPAGSSKRSPALPASAAKGKRNRAEESKPVPDGQGWGAWKWLALEKVPFVLLAVISSAVTFTVQQKGGAVSSLNTLSLGARAANALVSYLRYVGKLCWPLDLAVLYPHPGHWPAWLVIAAGLFLAGVTTAVVIGLRRKPYLAVGWFWFLGTLVPVIGLVQVGVQSMADRYTYVPMLGLLIMLAWGVPECLARWPNGNRAMALGSGIALGLCVLLTHRQVGYWQTSEKLFRHSVAVTKDNYLAYNNLGFFEDHEGKLDEALADYEKSLAINPNYEEAQNNLGYVLARQGRPAEAIPHYEAAVRIRPNLAEAHNNYGNALADLGRPDEAVAHYLIALRIKPELADAHGNYGIALAMQGKIDEGIQELKEALRLKPNDASTHSNLGNALAMQHKLEEAAAQYRMALELKPNEAQPHNNFGNVLAEQGKLEESAQQYAQALRLKADNPETQYNLGMVLLRQGKQGDALKHFQEALRLRPGYAEAEKQIAALMGGK